MINAAKPLPQHVT